jgi:hypothetical protein
MTNPQTSPSPQPATLRAVLDAISLRSVFGLDRLDRLDRMRLIEATREHLCPETDPELARELLARRTETLLALVTCPSESADAYAERAEIIGCEITFPGVPRAEYILLSVATWAALISDGRDVGVIVSMAPTAPPGPRD